MTATEPSDSIRLNAESDEYVVVSVVAVPPRPRDIWAILRGSYRPRVVRRSTVTTAGVDRALRQTWTTGRVRDVLYADNPLLAALEGHEAIVPIHTEDTP